MSGRRFSQRTSAIKKREELATRLALREEKKKRSIRKSKALSNREGIREANTETTVQEAGAPPIVDDLTLENSETESLEWDNSAEEPSFVFETPRNSPQENLNQNSKEIDLDITIENLFPSRRNTSTDDNFLAGDSKWPPKNFIEPSTI